MAKGTQELYREREKRVLDAIALRKPDRVPIVLLFGAFASSYANITRMEELYDLRSDPWEVRNLASDPAYGLELAAMRTRLADWEERTGDQGRIPETWAMYDSTAALVGPVTTGSSTLSGSPSRLSRALVLTSVSGS